MKAFRCQTENVIWVMVRYVPVAWCVRQFLRRGTAQLWALLSRADRDHRADRSAFVLLSSRGSNNVVQPPGTRLPAERGTCLTVVRLYRHAPRRQVQEDRASGSVARRSSPTQELLQILLQYGTPAKSRQAPLQLYLHPAVAS